MTVILTEPFNDLTAWTLGSGGTITAGGQVGTFNRMAGSSSRGYPIAAGGQSPYVDVEFWWRCSNIGSVNQGFFDIRSDAGSTIELVVNVTTAGAISIARGGITTIGTTTGVTLVANTWYRVRVVARLADAANGTVRVDVNGTTRLNIGPVLTYSTNPLAAAVWMRNTSGLNNDFDELLLSTGPPVTAPTVKVWNGTAFVSAPVKVYNGTAFVDAVAVKTWNGSAWV